MSDKKAVEVAPAEIIPFGSPLSPLCRDEARRELDARFDEDRPGTIVGLGKEQATDAWCAMIDWVIIDTAYNGEVFNGTRSDVPACKTDFVDGHYEFPPPAPKTVMAIEVIDMLGEEVLVTAAA